MKILGIIPARYNSTRFPGKPLANICGKPMIWWVYNQVKKTRNLTNVYVATDDERVSAICKKYNLNFIMTSTKHATSTERLFEVSNKINADYFICINGDEPLIDHKIIEAIIPNKIIKEEIFVSNLITEIKNPVEVIDSTNIKVVTDKDDFAVYFSRSPIPHPKASLHFSYKKHLGVLAYNNEALEFFYNTPRNKLESIEDVNELRFIENGHRIKMIEVIAETLSVDTPKDLEKVKNIMKERINKGEYNHE